MTISLHSAEDQQPALQLAQPEKVARMACCCKLSDLLPLVRQQLQALREQQAAAPRREAEAA
ncbi:hypothetical protein [Hymenobacter busanensis]|uniref:hypothetical protein n=1 Tax=Hymenobacter busanensis TaxID=2607656 RepID=UPI00136753CC|nr:hypothetical protein [Hymenobacter busanensis]QHJ07511.1 hypothetical protein GUY19_09550 [Hymenobacter busanensis]